MITKTAPTWWAKIYIAGKIEVAKQLLREEFKRIGLCVTIEPTLYLYSGGEEEGYVIGLINYPRFPTARDDINEKARKLVLLLLEKTDQLSASIMTPETTEWFSNRPEDNK